MSIPDGPERGFGFLSIDPSDESPGISGGLLILDRMGRPVEFHCTIPLVPNRAQEILYGQTLRQYMISDQIGQALLDKAKNQPHLLLTDVADVIALQQFSDMPILFTPSSEKVDWKRELHTASLLHWEFEGRPFGHDASFDPEVRCAPILREFHHLPNLEEPFERIHQALQHARMAA